MTNGKTINTLVHTKSKLATATDPSVENPRLCRQLARALQYLTFTRRDISYVVQQVCLYIHNLRIPHFTVLKRIIRYIKGAMSFGLNLYPMEPTKLKVFTDAD